MFRSPRLPVRAGLVLAAAALFMTGCSSPGTPASAPESTPAATVEQSLPTAADAVSISDAWVKASDGGMTAAFGLLANDSGDDVTVVSATTEASHMLELHETVAGDDGQMKMREIDGGFTIPADDVLALEPGGNHLMLMGLVAPLEPGQEVTITLTFSDGSTVAFTAPVKDFAGANETYENHGSQG